MYVTARLTRGWATPIATPYYTCLTLQDHLAPLQEDNTFDDAVAPDDFSIHIDIGLV